MADTTLYVVCGQSGEYSDRREWLTRAFRSEAAAQAEVERLGMLIQQIGWAGLRSGQWDGEAEEEAWEEAQATMKRADPGFNDGGGYDDPTWFIQPVELAPEGEV